MKQCLECGYKLDDGYTEQETLCGACYNLANNIDQEDASLPYCGDCLVPLHDCAHADIYKGERGGK